MSEPILGDGPLAAERVVGSADQQPLVLAHGVTQNRHCWGGFADALGQRFAVWAVDLPGHGASAHDTVPFEAAADLLAATIQRISDHATARHGPPSVDRHGGPIVIGYSMGGRLALRAALDHPGVASGLVLVGATAGLADADDRATRRAADAQVAARLRAEGPVTFLDRWLAQPLFADLTPEQQFRDERIRHWGSGVAETYEHRGTGSMEPLWDRLAELRAPTLVLAGADDHKFAAIGERLARGVGDAATLRLVPDAGHACHLAAPSATAAAVFDWLSRRPGRPAQ